MTKQYQTGTRKYIQKLYDKVAQHLDDKHKEYFKMGLIDFDWCLIYLPAVTAAFPNKLQQQQQQGGKKK